MEPPFFALLVIVFIAGFTAGIMFGRKILPVKHDETGTVMRIGASNVSGRGVFATQNIRNGEVIERCPALELDEKDVGGDLVNYVFYGENEHKRLVAMGSGMLFNHSSSPNVGYYLEETPFGPDLVIYALRDIRKGEELFYNYGEEWWATRNIAEIT